MVVIVRRVLNRWGAGQSLNYLLVVHRIDLNAEDRTPGVEMVDRVHPKKTRRVAMDHTQDEMEDRWVGWDWAKQVALEQ